MAAPHRNRNHPDDPTFEKSRAKIQTTQLVKRLQNHALEQDDDNGNQVKLDNSQIKAIQILIDKSLPSLQAVTLTGGDGGPVQLEHLTEGQLDARIEELKESSTDT